MSNPSQPRGPVGRLVNNIEETAIAFILGMMTVITFVNVVLRYIFNDSLIWGLELTEVLFAWLVLLGMSYAVKINAHLGVDAVLNILPTGPKRVLALISGGLCILYAVLLLKGAWDFWAPFGGFQQTGGRWFPDGFIKTRDQAWYETEQIPMIGLFSPFEGWLNQGEAYDKLPRFIPYFILPFGVALLLFRLIQAVWAIAAGRRESLIVSHEAEDAIEEVRHMNRED